MVVRKPHVIAEQQAILTDHDSKLEEVREFIQEVHADLKDLKNFYSMSKLSFIRSADNESKMSASPLLGASGF